MSEIKRVRYGIGEMCTNKCFNKNVYWVNIPGFFFLPVFPVNEKVITRKIKKWHPTRPNVLPETAPEIDS